MLISDAMPMPYSLDPATLLLPDVEASLAAWYASPLKRSTAQALLAAARRQEQHLLAQGASLFGTHLTALIAGYWLGRASDLEYRSLFTAAVSDQQALLDLVYGQLLMSRKRSGANDYLRSGFAAAARLLAPPDYFAILKRHELLRCLPLSEAGSTPMTLSDLLTEANVISRLNSTTGKRSGSMHNPDDTLG